ncbi:Dynein intermediate chain 2, ciliary-related protein [Tritrichomonas foetus]|uniref:Dynein axonemal intermediate chain 4 n=1 Tax=Tritrichomonas foetus TaxID=1144522 RepID=A0A1J4KR49_9EUKA|nr:Dynein intermediate chain 2, ciliary-related protein [Tritrichomonas foetus]|eukprot:OHT12276.1 Dynein intermediate chain 2, ciliary-related protein [Tritrichomonas foetus]
MEASNNAKAGDAEAQKTQQKDEDVNIFLNETPTIFLWQQQTSAANSAGPEAEEVQAINQRYSEFCQAIATSENFTERGNLTFHLFTKEKESQTDEVKKIEQNIQLDLHNLVEVPKTKKNEVSITPYSLLHDSCHPLASHEWSKTREDELKATDIKVDFGPNSPESNAIMHQMKTIGNSLFVLERMVQQNIHLDKILAYTSPAADVDTPNVEPLLKFQNNLTFMRPVTGLSFNPQSANFFAASYGPVADIAVQQGQKPPVGIICVWNILNPGQPERVIETESAPTSIKFSEGVPYLIAAGFADGAVGLFDIRQKKCECIAMSTVENGSHEGTVGEVVFQQRTDTRVRSEAVVSVAAGGRVTQWTVANGLEHKDLVTLKKLKVVGKEGETQTLRYEDLHCISFSQSQPNIYVVGSEDGALFVCDTQYNEDFTQKLLFHFRSVLSVKFSPIAPNWFISGSCDGSAAVWNTHRQTPVAAFYLGKATFNDIEWSPISGTVFAAACSDGECRIWDISLDSVDPVAKLTPYDKKEFTSLDWSPHLPVFISGNVVGVVYLTKVVGLASLNAGRSREEEIKRFTSVIQMMSNQE